MTPEERVALAKTLLNTVEGVTVAELPKDVNDAPELAKARELVSPVELPANYEYMGAVDKAKVLELALDQLQKRNSELLTELEHRTQWEAVRISTAIRERNQEENSRAQAIVEKALAVQSERFQRAMRNQKKKMEQELQIQGAKAAAEMKNKMEAQMHEIIQQERAAAEESEKEAVDNVTMSLSRKNAADSEARLESIRDLQLQIEALSKVVQEDAHLKMKSQQVHRVSQAALSLANRLDNSAPFKEEISVLREVAVDDPVFAAAVGYIPPTASKTGVKTYGQLRAAFQELAPETRRAALLPSDAGPLWIPLAYIFDALKFKPSGNVAGLSCEEILARAEYNLNKGELELAVKEVDNLDGLPAQVMVEWQGAAKERLSVEQALSIIKAHSANLVAQVNC